MKFFAVLTLAFAPLAVCAAEPPPVEVPYRLTDTKHVLIRAKINGKGPFNLICDSGAPAVFITKGVAKMAGVTTDDKGWADFATLTLEGGLDVPRARGRVEDLFQLEGMNGMGLAGVELHGVIGYNVLAKYRITYDFTKDKLTWQPLPDFEPPAITGGRKGGGQGGLEVVGSLMKVMAAFMGVKVNFNVLPRGFAGVEIERRDDGVFVRSVLPDSPAGKAGLKPGDRILKIKTTAIDDERDLTRALAKAGVGDTLTFQVKRGNETHDIVVTLGKGL